MSMARRPLLWTIAVFGILNLPSCAPFGNDTDLPGETARALLHQGIERTYQLFVPSGYDGMAVPLVLVYHETFGSGRAMTSLTNFNALAERERIIVAYPDAVEGSWNDGRAGRVTSIDDVDFTRALIDHIRGEFAVDLHRVYATGYSNGGHMVNRLALVMGETFAAVAPVASLLSVDLPVLVPEPMSHMPILIVHGTADPLIPFTGGPIVLSHGEVFSAAGTVDYWVGLNEASRTAKVEEMPDIDPADGTTARRETYAPLTAQGAEVVFIVVEGGGHTWAGGNHFLLGFLIGATSKDFSATEEIWSFFSRHSR